MTMKARGIVFSCVTAGFIYFAIVYHHATDIPDVIATGVYLGLAAAPVVCFFYRPIRRFRISMVLMIPLRLFRAFHFSCSLDSYKAVKIALYAFSFVVECILLLEIPSKYFELPPVPGPETMEMHSSHQERSTTIDAWKMQGEYYLIDDPSLAVPSSESDSLVSTSSLQNDSIVESESSTASFQRSLNMEKRHVGATKVEIAVVIAVFVCAVVVVILSALPGIGDSSKNDSNFNYTFPANIAVIGATSFFPLVLIPIQIMKVKKVAEDGAEIAACNHSNGLAFLLLTGGFAIHFIICCAFTLADGLSFMQNQLDTASSCAIVGIEVITVILPLGFHLFNVTKSASSTFVCNTAVRMRIVSYFIVIALHILIVALIMLAEPTDHFDQKSFAKVTGTVATIDFLFLLSGSLSPIMQLLYQSAMRKSIHDLYLHRLISTIGAIFAVLHIVLALVDDDIATRDHLHLILGGISAFMFFLAGSSGVALSKWRYTFRPAFYRALCFLHIPCTFFGLVLLFTHQFQEPKAWQNRLFIAFMLTCLTCMILYSNFLIFNPLHSVQLDVTETEWGTSNSKYIFLVADFKKTAPAGAYFLLYSNTKSHLNYFHTRPIHVFSSKNSRLAFLVESSTDNGRKLLFSHVAKVIPESILIQGPYQDGTASLFMEYVRSVPVGTDVYLCGWDAGFAKIFSILENLKEIWPFTNIRKIVCVFNVIPDQEVSNRVHKFLNQLVKNWKSKIPVTIVESTEADLQNILTLSEQVNFSTKASTIDFFRQADARTQRSTIPSPIPASRPTQLHSSLRYSPLFPSPSPPSPFTHSLSSSSSSHRSFHNMVNTQQQHSPPDSTLDPLEHHDNYPPIPPSISLHTRARWVVMRDEQDYVDVIQAAPAFVVPNGFRNRVLYFCGTPFQPKMFRGWKYFVETL